jgi:FAD/FMN-containing dehydrogenase
MLLYPASVGSKLVRAYRDFMEAAPDLVGTGLSFITVPPLDEIPAELVGQPAIGIVCCCTGPLEEATEALRPLREAVTPALDLVEPMPYVAVQQLLDPANQHGRLNYWSADILDHLPDEAIDVLVVHGTAAPSPLSTVILVPGGGAVARVDDEATAFGSRRAPWNVHFLTMWADPADTDVNVAYTKTMSAAMKPWATGAVYLNYIGDEGPARIRSAYSAATYERLRAIKAVWDPDNMFRHNQNIPPSTTAGRGGLST